MNFVEYPPYFEKNEIKKGGYGGNNGKAGNKFLRRSGTT